jgi:hypothetical protein
MIATEKDITVFIRECDRLFTAVGGSTRHYVRDVFIPRMEEEGFIMLKLSEQAKKIDIDSVEIKREIAKGLREKGYSLRQIQRSLGYKSVRSVVHILNK